jgi:hypothetical protein
MMEIELPIIIKNYLYTESADTKLRNLYSMYCIIKI